MTCSTMCPVKKAFNNKCMCKHNYNKNESVEMDDAKKTYTKKYKTRDFLY